MERVVYPLPRSPVPSPGRLIAAFGNGLVEQSNVVSSPDARRIKRVYEYDSQIAIELTTPSTGDNAFSTGEALHVRLGGWDGATNQLHRATGYDMMAGDGLRNPYSAALDATGVNFGGSPKTIDVLDASNIVIRDELWKIRAEDPAPVFLGDGQVHRKSTLVDVRSWFEEMFTENDDEPFFSITMGAGIFVLKPSDTPEAVQRVFYPPAHFTLRGMGAHQTILFRDDYYNATPFIYRNYGCTDEDYTQDGNRAFQRFATHGFKLTAPDDDEGEDSNVHYYARRRTRLVNIPGYGGNMGHPGAKRRFDLVNNEYNVSTTDGQDMKGPKSTNLEGLIYDGDISGNRFRSPGVLYYGTNRTRPLTLATDPITTNGTSSVVVFTGQKAFRGQRVKFGEGTPDQDGVEFAAHSFKVTNRAKVGSLWNATIDVSPQVATGSSTGGGSGVEITMPACAKGKPAFDGRGWGLRIVNNEVSGYLLRNTIGRLRGKDGTNGNGAGGHYAQIIGLTAFDETPVELGYTDGKGLTVLAEHVTVNGYKCHRNGLGGGLVVSPLATGFQGSAIDIIGANTAGGLGAPGMNIFAHAYDCNNGFLIDGSDGADTEGELEDDPATVTNGSSIVELAWSNTDTDRPAATEEFNLSGIDIGYGVDLNSSWEVIDDSDPDFITFDCFQPAVVPGGGSVTFGGEGTTYEITNTVIEASGSLNLEMEDMGSGYGVDIGNKTPTDGGLRIKGSYSGTGTAAQGSTGRPRWDPGNFGLPNNQRRIDLPTSGTATALTKNDGNTRFDLPVTASGIVSVPLPAASAVAAAVTYSFLAKNGTGAIGIQLQAQGTDQIKLGASSSSAGGTITSSTVGATLTLERAETGQRAWYVTSYIGTWTLA